MCSSDLSQILRSISVYDHRFFSAFAVYLVVVTDLKSVYIHLIVCNLCRIASGQNLLGVSQLDGPDYRSQHWTLGSHSDLRVCPTVSLFPLGWLRSAAVEDSDVLVAPIYFDQPLVPMEELKRALL